MHRCSLAMVGLATALVFSPWCSSSRAGVVDELSGRWGESGTGPATLTWMADGTGFTVTWNPSDGASSEVRYEPAQRPAIFAGQARGRRSMLQSMFGADGPVNPLVDGTLYWARVDDETVYLYSLTVDDRGDFRLERIACRREGDVLSVSLARRTGVGSERIVERRLEPVRP